MQVAQTILEHLGGSRFIAMTGARNFVGSADALMFALPRGAKNKANKVRVTLRADLYSVEFFRIRGVDVKPCGSREFVYADQLQAVFTSETGLDTRL